MKSRLGEDSRYQKPRVIRQGIIPNNLANSVTIFFSIDIDYVIDKEYCSPAVIFENILIA